MRVWLHSVVGSEVIVYNDQGSDGTKYFRLMPDGQFQSLPMQGDLLSTDGKVIGWSVFKNALSGDLLLSGSSIEVWSAPYTAEASDLKTNSVNVAVIKVTDVGTPTSPILTNHSYAFASDSGMSTRPVTIHSVDLPTGTVRTVSIPPLSEPNGFRLLATTERYIWLAFRAAVGGPTLGELKRIRFQ